LCNYNEIQKSFSKTSEVIDYFICEEFYQNSPNEDYAILILNNTLGKETGYFGILPFKDLYLKNNLEYTFCGYEITSDTKLIDILIERKIKRIEIKEKEKNDNYEIQQKTYNTSLAYLKGKIK
jgi:hypothetical protein